NANASPIRAPGAAVGVGAAYMGRCRTRKRCGKPARAGPRTPGQGIAGCRIGRARWAPPECREGIGIGPQYLDAQAGKFTQAKEGFAMTSRIRGGFATPAHLQFL